MNINSRQVEVFSQQLFIILPRHLFTIKNHSSDLKLNLIFLSLDFLHQLPVSPDLDILKKAYDQPIIILCQEKYSEITGGKIKRLASVTDIKNIHQIKRFTNILDSMGVYEELRKYGIKQEDTIIAEGIEFIYDENYY